MSLLSKLCLTVMVPVFCLVARTKSSTSRCSCNHVFSRLTFADICREFWTLLNFIDPTEFRSEEDFIERYGDLTVKDRIDEMHERIRPYILRRLKEDVEKSVPPKEETLIEVELSLVQKQYYRAIYEKNVQFLCKHKGKTMDGPSLLNLHMEVRKKQV